MPTLVRDRRSMTLLIVLLLARVSVEAQKHRNLVAVLVAIHGLSSMFVEKLFLELRFCFWRLSLGTGDAVSWCQ